MACEKTFYLGMCRTFSGAVNDSYCRECSISRAAAAVETLQKRVRELEDAKARNDAWKQNELKQSFSVGVDARRRHYDICTHAIDPLGLSIQLERLEKLGVSKKVTKRWKDIAMAVLHDMLDVSDAIK